MMLELRPNCELCNKDLPPASLEAMICSYECTYCKSCVDSILHNVCLKCGGGFVPRPIRPRKAWHTDYSLGLGHHPASTKRVTASFSAEEIANHVQRIEKIPPEDR
nr:DUF1272 domain-containing protein [Sneathiella aquimaris]